jgi:hypothetical protein
VGQAAGEFDGFPDGFVRFFVTNDGNKRTIHGLPLLKKGLDQANTKVKNYFTMKSMKDMKGLKSYKM